MKACKWTSNTIWFWTWLGPDSISCYNKIWKEKPNFHSVGDRIEENWIDECLTYIAGFGGWASLAVFKMMFKWSRICQKDQLLAFFFAVLGFDASIIKALIATPSSVKISYCITNLLL